MSNPQNPNPWQNPNQPPQGQPPYGPPPGQYGAPPPQGQPPYGPPPGQYGAPPPGQPPYGPPPGQYGAPPPGQYGAPPPGQPPYGPPPGQYGAPPPGYGQQPPQYGQQFGQNLGFGQAPAGVKAGFGPRAVAFIIDGIIVGIPAGIINAILSGIFIRNTVADCLYGGNCNTGFSIIGPIIWLVIYPSLWALYAFICYSAQNGNTVGKKVMGLKLVTEDGVSKPDQKTFILHFAAGYLINSIILGIGYLFPLWDPSNKTLGQKVIATNTVTGSLVILLITVK